MKKIARSTTTGNPIPSAEDLYSVIRVIREHVDAGTGSACGVADEEDAIALRNRRVANEHLTLLEERVGVLETIIEAALDAWTTLTDGAEEQPESGVAS